MYVYAEKAEVAAEAEAEAVQLAREAELYLSFWAEAGPGRVPFADEAAAEAALLETIAELNASAELEAAHNGN